MSFIERNLFTGTDMYGHQDRPGTEHPKVSFYVEVDPASQAPVTAFDQPGGPELADGSADAAADDPEMLEDRSGESSGTPAGVPDSSSEPHVCATIHSTERALARCHFDGALVSGLGPYAVVIGCGLRTRVRLFKSHVSCGRALALLERRGCGRGCTGDHRLAVIGVGFYPAVTWAGES